MYLLTIFFEWIYSTAKTSCRNFSLAFASVKRFSRIRKSVKEEYENKILYDNKFANLEVHHLLHILLLNKWDSLIPLPIEQRKFIFDLFSFFWHTS